MTLRKVAQALRALVNLVDAKHGAGDSAAGRSESDEVMARSLRLLEQLPVSVPRPFELGAFLEGVERWSGQPLELRRMPETGVPDMPTGLWTRTDVGDYVWFSELAAPLHGEQIVVHEIAHMFWGHEPHPRTDPAVAARLLPHLPTGIFAHCYVAGRAAYTSMQEREAETLATLILGSAVREVPVRAQHSAQQPSLQRAATLLGG